MTRLRYEVTAYDRAGELGVYFRSDSPAEVLTQLRWLRAYPGLQHVKFRAEDVLDGEGEDVEAKLEEMVADQEGAK